MTVPKNQDIGAMPEGISQDYVDVNAVLQRQLGVERVTRISGPMIREGKPLSSGRINVVFRIKETGLSGVLVFESKDGENLLKSINFLTTDRPSLLMRDLREIPLKEISNEVKVVLNSLDAENPEKFVNSFEQFTKARLRRPGRGKSLDGLDLLSLAVKYADMRGKRKIYETLSAEFGYSKSSLKNSVCRARREGLLEPTKKGCTNFNLTQKAYDLIKQHGETPQIKEGN
jgi:coenzyme F420-reducing hydrogenase delta subunit